MRLLAGMVKANRPWRLVPSLSPAMAGAAAGAAFGIFYSSIWLLADAFIVPRLLLVNALALAAMIAWLIIDNGLWVRASVRRVREPTGEPAAPTAGGRGVRGAGLVTLPGPGAWPPRPARDP